MGDARVAYPERILLDTLACGVAYTRGRDLQTVGGTKIGSSRNVELGMVVATIHQFPPVADLY